MMRPILYSSTYIGLAGDPHLGLVVEDAAGRKVYGLFRRTGLFQGWRYRRAVAGLHRTWHETYR